MSVHWKPEYSVGVRKIDNQHKELIKVLQDLYKFIHKENTEERINEVIDTLSNYIKVHFSTEENYFEKFKYEEAIDHKKEHDKFKEKIIELKDNLEKDKLKTCFDLIDFIEDWFLDHMIVQDQKYIECFKENGLK